MVKPILFMLAPGFNDRGRPEFCPECAELWGVLSYYPAIKEALDIRYMPIEKPRDDLAGLLGAAHQNGPTLVFPKDSALSSGARTQTANGYDFIDNARDIAVYFAHTYATPFPRGHE